MFVARNVVSDSIDWELDIIDCICVYVGEVRGVALKLEGVISKIFSKSAHLQIWFKI